MTEQEVHDPHGLTSQSTERKIILKCVDKSLLTRFHTRCAINQIASVSLCKRNYSGRGTFCAIVWCPRYFPPEWWKLQQLWELISCTLSYFWCPHHMWRSKRSMTPIAWHCSQLNNIIFSEYMPLLIILIKFFSYKSYLASSQQHCRCQSLQEELSLPIHILCHCLMQQLFSPWIIRISPAMDVNWLHLVLFLMPPPHVTEQEVHDPHGLTSQSTERRKKI